MSKRVANTRERTARNGRVRFHWMRKRAQEQKQAEHEVAMGAILQREKPPTFMERVRRVFRHQKRGS